MVHGEVICNLYVVGQQLNGSDELCLTFVMPDAHANVTVNHTFRGGKIWMNLYMNKITTGQLYTTNSTFGPVNDLMLQ